MSDVHKESFNKQAQGRGRFRFDEQIEKIIIEKFELELGHDLSK
ncbi:hypothetical protein [Paraflavitalea devenefica]|nr:hypothetical protein [Paraflavitalea devenefica]